MKKYISAALALLLAFMLCVPVFAETADEVLDVLGDYYSDEPEITLPAPTQEHIWLADDADLFTDEQEQALLASMDEISQKYDGFNIAFHTTDSIGSKTVVAYADDYYDSLFGINTDGLLFMLNMNHGEEGNRDYYTSTSGYGITAFTDYAIYDEDSKINSEVLYYLSDGDYYGAFTEYLSLMDIFLAQAEAGEPYDVSNPYKTSTDYIVSELFLIVAGLVIAFVVVMVLKGKMKTNVLQTNAREYVKQGSLQLVQSSDTFSHTTLTKVARPKETSSSGGGSSTHSSSSGGTHGGGGGKF